MWEFIHKLGAAVIGVLSGFDRIVFRGTLRNMAYQDGMWRYLNVNHIPFTDAGDHWHAVSERVKAAIVERAERENRPVVYLPSAATNKEAEARKVAEKDGVKGGLVCVLKAVEPCATFEIHRNREKKILELKPSFRQCLHYYHYWVHPEFGWMNARLQSWFPFGIQVCMNGREWLSKRLDREGMRYVKKENCFTWLENPKRAQELADEQLKTDWSTMLDERALQVHPLLNQVFGKYETRYYWSAHQTEWATDVMFKTPRDLAALYPRLTRHAMTTFHSPDVLRFLGQKTPACGGVHGRLKAEVTSDLKARMEGVRIKHRAGGNAIKMYDKQGSVLRVETTLADPGVYKAFRAPEGKPEAEKKWRRMRKGVADMHRRAQVSQAGNTRYLAALAKVEIEEELAQCLSRVGRPAEIKGRRVRALNVFGEDAELLSALGRGEHAVNGFRNRDLQCSLYAKRAESKAEQKRRSSRVSRLLRMLRAHQLIAKVCKTHRYQLTQNGQKIVVALSVAKQSSIKRLIELAA